MKSLSRIQEDQRIDPRIKSFLTEHARIYGADSACDHEVTFWRALVRRNAVPARENPGDATSREQIIETADSEEEAKPRREFVAFVDQCDTEEIAPSAGLAVTTREVASEPDGNIINIQFIRLDGEDAKPCVYYIHGGGMHHSSCYDGNYKAWGSIIAGQGVAVAMVDFRNAVLPSSVPEIAPFPAGLNDCVAGLKWIAANAAELGIDASRVIVAGEQKVAAC